nr:leukotriene A-4 hydrolase homolog [Ipomoea batatas]
MPGDSRQVDLPLPGHAGREDQILREAERSEEALGGDVREARACEDSIWCAEDRIVEEFVMDQPIPPYLFAFAVGELGFREVGPRTRVYSEATPAVLDAAAEEFAGTEEIIRVGEKLFGAYEWERFDLLVLPPSFPYGGMENPRMVFLTPTVIKGDATGAQGFTTYAERRIVEVVQGEERAAMNIGIGWRGLVEDVERFKDNLEFTKLKTNQAGVDPDDVYSSVPYEKGFQFLWRIERQIGRPAFDEFLKKYIATFKFQSIDTDMFIEFLKANIPGIGDEVDLKLWTRVRALDARYRLSESKNYEVRVGFLKLGISAGCREYYSEVEKTLKEVGRMLYLRPLYTALVQGDGKEEDKVFARRVFSEACDCYHPIAKGVVEAIFAKFG